MMFRFLTVLFILCIWSSSSVFALEETLNLGILAVNPKAEEETRWQALADYLSRSLPGKKIQVQALGYPELENKILHHELDFVLTNPGHYIQLRQENALSGALATLQASVNNQALDAFGGVIFALKQRDDINHLADLKNKTIAITSTSSLGGYQAQAYQLVLTGLAPGDVRLLRMGMPHDAIINALLTKKADVGFVRTGVLESLAQKGKLDLNQFKIINRQDMPSFPFILSTRLYPEWPFIAMPHVKEELARLVTAQLLMIDHNGPMAKAGGYHGFTIPANYSPVEELLRTLRLPPFDAMPTFTWQDILVRYQYQIGLFAMAGMLIGVLSLLLLVKNRQLSAARNNARENEHKLATILDSLGAHVFIKDLNFRYVFANQTVCELFATRQSEIIGSEDDCFFNAETSRHIRINDRRVIENGERLECVETNTIKSTGEQRCFLSIKLPLRDCEGQIYALCGISTDITERQRIEDQLHDSQQHFERLVEISPIGVFETDEKGGCVFVNSRWSEITGISLENALGNAWATALHPDDKDAVWHEWQQSIQENRPFSLEYRFLNPNGKESWVLGQSVSMQDNQGAIIGYIGAITDITTAKQAALDLQRSNADLEQFAYAISHDMRQPLRMVSSYLSLIERALAPQLDGEIRQFLAFASDGAKRMDQMILSLLEFSRVGRKTQPITCIASRAVLEEALAFLGPEINANGATVTVLGDWPELMASRDELSRLLQNLIGNAIKYHAENEAPQVTVEAKITSGLFRVEVHDRGIGIDSTQTDRLFKVFSRLQTRSRFEGTGVGLAICRKIVEHHGGRIGVESPGEGQGSCFWFELPQLAPRPNQTPTTSFPRSASLPLRNKK